MPAEDRVKRHQSAIRLFRIAGIQITIDYSWFVIFFLVLWSLAAGYFPRNFPGQPNQAYWASGIVATLLFFFSILFHELSHSFMAIRSGIKIPEITLFIFGGISRLSQEAKDPRSELKIALIGPLSSFVLAAFFGLLQVLTRESPSLLISAVFGYLAWINIALGVFNLIPGFPLDGGRALRAVLWQKSGSISRATKLTSNMGKGFAVALMILGAFQVFGGMLLGGIWLLFIGMFLRGMAEGGYQELVVRQSLEGVPVKEVMIHEVVSVAPDLGLDGLVNEYLLRYGYKGFPVVEKDAVLGLVSLSDVRRIPLAEHAMRTVRDVMAPNDGRFSISPDFSLADALKTMMQSEASRLLVMEGNKMVGMITKTGLMRFIEIKRILDI